MGVRVAPLRGAGCIIMVLPTTHAAVGYSWCSRSAATAVLVAFELAEKAT